MKALFLNFIFCKPKFRLDIKPKHGDWTPDDVIRFQGLTVTKKFVASIIRKNRDGSYDLSLIDTSGEDDIEIMKILIEEGRAIQD